MEGFLRDEILKLGLQLEGHLELSPECRCLHVHYSRTVLATRGFKLFWIQTHLVNPPCSGFCNVTHDSLHSSETMLCFLSFKFIGQWMWNVALHILNSTFPVRLSGLEIWAWRWWEAYFSLIRLSGMQIIPFLRAAQNLGLLFVARVTEIKVVQGEELPVLTLTCTDHPGI